MPTVEAIHDLDDADKVCTQCGGRLQEWEGQFEESPEIDVIGRQWVIRKHLRKKYRCNCGAWIETAPAARKLFPGALYSIDAAIELAVGKYDEHLPLERQVRIMKREGLQIDSQTLWDQIERRARYGKDAYAAIECSRARSSSPTRLPGSSSTTTRLRRRAGRCECSAATTRSTTGFRTVVASIKHVSCSAGTRAT